MVFFVKLNWVAFRGDLPGAARQPLTFFALAKESKQRKATASRCPCGVPKRAGDKAGSETNSPAAQTSFASLSALPPALLAASAAELPCRLDCVIAGTGRRFFVSFISNVFV
jgi:hypothetical protein